MGKDVVKVLRELTAGSNVQRIRAAEDAIDRIAELIAADVRLQWIRKNGCGHAEYEEAIRAHDAALAACRGM